MYIVVLIFLLSKFIFIKSTGEQSVNDVLDNLVNEVSKALKNNVSIPAWNGRGKCENYYNYFIKMTIMSKNIVSESVTLINELLKIVNNPELINKPEEIKTILDKWKDKYKFNEDFNEIKTIWNYWHNPPTETPIYFHVDMRESELVRQMYYVGTFLTDFWVKAWENVNEIEKVLKENKLLEDKIENICAKFKNDVQNQIKSDKKFDIITRAIILIKEWEEINN